MFFSASENMNLSSSSRLFVWSGNIDLLMAIIKSTEDQSNVLYDTNRAKVRVIILIEDSPGYRSSLLPQLYREIVLQTQKVMDDSLNEEHRLLRMRARPKILLAENYEEAENLYKQFKPYLLSVCSDVCFNRNGQLNKEAGFVLCDMIKKETPGLPLLILSSNELNREKAMRIPAVFLNKNSPLLHKEIRSFLEQYLGFGDFVFRLPDGREVARVSNLRQMEKVLPIVPDESIFYHAEKDHFSTWLMARSEIQLASKLQPLHTNDFSNILEIKNYLVACIRKERKDRQRGIITDFTADDFDPDTDFTKIGNGSLGGKGRGLAFISSLLGPISKIKEIFPETRISIPKTLVITTEFFDAFVNDNNLKALAESHVRDSHIAEKFLESRLSNTLVNNLKRYLSCVKKPLAVRSSSLLEDSQFQPYAGIYKTYMIPNNDPDISVRLKHLIRAIKLVYASTYFEAPKSFSKNTSHRIEEEKMAVIIQQIKGKDYDGFYYPAVSGIAQSYNFYPVSYMKPEEGVVHIAFGLGKTVAEGGTVLRFSPLYPQLLPQYSNVDDILKNSQRFFFGLKLSDFKDDFGISKTPDGDFAFDSTLTRLEISDVEKTVENEKSLRTLFSTFIPEDHKIRDSFLPNGHHILSFAGILKYNQFQLNEIIPELLEIGQRGMGAPIELEFAINFPEEDDPKEKRKKPELVLLQIRPMVVHSRKFDIQIDKTEIKKAFCFSENAMGNGIFSNITSIIFIKPESFDPARTMEIASEISKFNKTMIARKQKYLLVGPGRWGSADKWLGIPVTWKDISNVGAIVETSNKKLQTDPSQGTHFFHNITSLGIGYITIKKSSQDFIDEKWLGSLPAVNETRFIRHVNLGNPLIVKIDGKGSLAVILKPPVKPENSK